MLFQAKIHERENQVCDDRNQKQAGGVRRGSWGRGRGRGWCRFSFGQTRAAVRWCEAALTVQPRPQRRLLVLSAAGPAGPAPASKVNSVIASQLLAVLENARSLRWTLIHLWQHPLFQLVSFNNFQRQL